jgi:alcohol dehydrogenase class IV
VKVDKLPKYEDVEKVALSNNLPKNVVAIGGGSTIDFAKGVMAKRMFGEIENLGIGLNSGSQNALADKPNFIAVPSTVGSGAESSRYFVLYREKNKEKVHGKSWSLIADFVLIDPNILKSAPLTVIVSSAFDSFIHFFESAICSKESNHLTKVLSRTSMLSIINNLELFLSERTDERLLMNLGILSSLSGIAISNSRTGNIHEAAGALIEHVDLSHGETLFIFFKKALGQYQLKIRPFLDEFLLNTNFVSFDEVVAFWEQCFIRAGLISKIMYELERLDDKVGVMNSIIMRLAADKVWNEKESPIQVTQEMIDELAKAIFI